MRSPYRPGMGGQRPLARRLILGVDVLQVGGERGLGVDHQMAPLGQVDQRIGASLAGLGGKAPLALVVLTGAQAGAVEHVLQHQLAPVALDLLLPLERLGQLRSLVGDIAIELLQVLELGGQAGALGRLLMVQGLDLLAKALDLLLEGLEQPLQVALGERREGPTLLLQQLVGQVFELHLELALALLHPLKLAGEVSLLLLQAGSQLAMGLLERIVGLAEALELPRLGLVRLALGLHLAFGNLQRHRLLARLELLGMQLATHGLPLAARGSDATLLEGEGDRKACREGGQAQGQLGRVEGLQEFHGGIVRLGHQGVGRGCSGTATQLSALPNHCCSRPRCSPSRMAR